MIQRAETQMGVLQDIADRISRGVKPWRVVLFGSRARGNPKVHSDYDVYVEVDADREALGGIELEIRALFRGTGLSLDFKVRPRGEIERRRDDPGTIEWDVAREGMLLYADPAAPRDLAPTARVREPSPEPPTSLAEWLEVAQRDLEHARYLWGAPRGFSPEICWLSQQSAEKYMKALLVSRNVRPERTHNLVSLLAALRAAACALPGIDADCELLTKHAVTPRYPAGNVLREPDARVAFAAAERVVEAVREELP